ncbi:hypothetical protein EW145_g2538 [Phellinidium pouzarii]|uniref:Uncharacterized protein n=1 Tax=Phellinidium pouzarii TaxID=167371 RepID=A0A4S4LAE3_9AGAM|nr:hypothetical protein EW145_g2538 [Phellinidium pouzarii]
MSPEQGIPRIQRAYILQVVCGPLKLVTDHPVPAAETLLPGQCLVRLTHSGVCHSDHEIKNEWYKGLKAKADTSSAVTKASALSSPSAHIRSTRTLQWATGLGHQAFSGLRAMSDGMGVLMSYSCTESIAYHIK